MWTFEALQKLNLFDTVVMIYSPSLERKFVSGILRKTPCYEYIRLDAVSTKDIESYGKATKDILIDSDVLMPLLIPVGLIVTVQIM